MQNAKQQTKALWLRTFDDSEEFVDFYFEKYFSDKNNIFVEQNGKIISALQALPFSLQIENKIVPSAYLSGICTDENFQHQGFMRELLTKTHRQLFENQYWAATLIPASENLEKMYQKFGYATLISTQMTQIKQIGTDNIDKNRKKNLCKSIKSASSACQNPLFNQIQKIYSEIIEDNFPYGMLRIINVEKILNLFAELNPEKELELNVFDEIITANCGNYQLKNGSVIKNETCHCGLDPQSPENKTIAEQVRNDNNIMKISDLADFIFKNQNLSVNLTLNE
jgi:predicted acetyltransferase